MANTTFMDRVDGKEEREKTEVLRTGRFLIFFKTKWWETVSERSIGNDIHISTNREIRTVYLNGIPLAPKNT